MKRLKVTVQKMPEPLVSTVNQKEFYGSRPFCFGEENSVNRRVDRIFTDNQLVEILPMISADAS